MESRPGTYGRKKKSVSNPVTVFVTIGICLACWYLAFSGSVGIPLTPEPQATPLWHAVCSLFAGQHILLYVGSCLLLFFTSFLIQRGSFLLLIIKGKTLLPFLFFLLLNSTNPEGFPIRSAAVAQLFLLAAFYGLFRSYQEPVNVGRIYNATMYISLGSLLWVHVLWFIPLFWFGMYKFRVLTIRSFFASVLGFFTTYWFVLAWCVWKHDYSLFVIPLQNLVDIHPDFMKETLLEKVVPFSMIAFIIMAIYIVLRELNTLRTRQYFTFLVIFSLYSFLLIFLYEQDSANMLSVFFIPVSVLLAYLFSNISGFFGYLFYYGLVFLFLILFAVRLWNF